MSAAALVMLLVCIAAPCALAAWFERRLSATEDQLVATQDALEDSVLETDDARLRLDASDDARAFLSASLEACAQRGKDARAHARDLRRSLADVTAERDALRAELARERAARVESDRRRAVAVAHVREVRAELRVTEEHRAHFYFIALDLVCQRDAARSEAVLARHEQVVLPGDCARARGSEMPS